MASMAAEGALRAAKEAIGVKYHESACVNKKTQLALLYDNICKLEREGKISINPDLQENLQAESTKKRHRPSQDILSPRLREAAQQLRDNEHIIIRKADKSNTFVILDRDCYLDKCNNLLGDPSKFQPLSRNPTVNLKSKVNSLIHAANAVIGDLKFDSITGDITPGYFYGNVKTHKEGNPLRPIISQIPTPTYSLAKRLNQIITPYIPTTHSLKSTDEFVDILRCNKPSGILASLDAESLFSHVPLIRTVDIILNYTYRHPVLPPPKLSEPILKDMLLACTSEAPFKCPLDYHTIMQAGSFC
ncbi:uncharacterized protein LOC143024558 [Oratosquilla oratoria]|uniref:uncharacterized protein LOC143024558 n=1 Tax=Oratosquilla oratoria TaxID=337810 RepID=UPI003F76C664